MSRLNLDPRTLLLRIDVIAVANGLPGLSENQTEVFDRHLEQARQTMDQAANGPRSSIPESRPAADDQKAAPSSPPEDRSDDPSTQDASLGGTEQQDAAASETQSDPDREAGSDQSDRSSGEDDDERHPEAAAAQAAEGATTAPRSAPVAEAESGGPPTPAVNVIGPEGVTKLPHGKGRSALAGDPAPGEAAPSGGPDAVATPDESSVVDRQAEDAESSQTRDRQAKPEVAWPTLEWNEDGNKLGRGAVNSGRRAGLQPLDASSRASRSASDSSSRGGRQGAGNSADAAGDRLPAAQTSDAEVASTQQNSRGGLPTVWAAASADNAAENAAKTPTGDRGNDTLAARASPSQGSRPASAARGHQASGSEPLDRVRFVQRVVRAFEAVGDRNGSVRLRLHPPDLGNLRLEVTVRDGMMTARMEVETTTARSMLLDNLPALRDRLADQDIRVTRFDVDLTDHSSGGLPQRPDAHPQSHGHPEDNAPQPNPDQDAEMPPLSQPRAVGQPGQGNQLDVMI